MDFRVERDCTKRGCTGDKTAGPLPIQARLCGLPSISLLNESRLCKDIEPTYLKKNVEPSFSLSCIVCTSPLSPVFQNSVPMSAPQGPHFYPFGSGVLRMAAPSQPPGYPSTLTDPMLSKILRELEAVKRTAQDTRFKLDELKRIEEVDRDCSCSTLLKHISAQMCSFAAQTCEERDKSRQTLVGLTEDLAKTIEGLTHALPEKVG